MLLITTFLAAGFSCGPLGSRESAGVRPVRAGEADSSSFGSVYIVQPDYPQRALEQRLEGSVDLMAEVDREGRVVDAWIERSTNEIFNDAALAAAVRCRFKIPVSRPESVPGRVVIPYRFALPDSLRQR